MVGAVGGFYGHVDMEAVSCLVFQWLGTEISKDAVQPGNGLYYGLKGHGVVGGSQRVRIAEVDLILPRPLLMVRAFRQDPHLVQHKADLAAYILALVFGGDIHIGRVVMGDLGGRSVVVQPEQIKFLLRSKEKLVSGPVRVLDGPP